MSESPRCPRCDSVLLADAPAGLCPKCLVQAGFESRPISPANPDPTVLSPASSGFEPPAVEELSGKFPQLEILEFLGKGGMGAVYKARQTGLDRFVAVKILPQEVGRDPAFAERFTREARALARLSHPNIVAVHDFGHTGGLYYFVMELIDGADLRQAMQAGQLHPQQALVLVPQICDALQYAHDEGVVHRDIKPENILLDKRGRVKIADFGLSKLVASNGRELPAVSLTGTHQVMGTVRYMAPEQMQGTRSVDHRADIYSLGVVFYEMLTGDLPMGRFAPPSKKVHIDVRLDEVVLRALEQNPEQRYQQASEVKSELDTIRTTVAPPLMPGEQRDPRDSFRELALFAMTPNPSYAKRVGVPMLILFGLWLAATIMAHVVYGQPGNYQEGPILLIQGGGMLLLVLVSFVMHMAFAARSRVEVQQGSGPPSEPGHVRASVPVEIVATATTAFAFAIAAVKGICELAQRPSPLDAVAVPVTVLALLASGVLLVVYQLRRPLGPRGALPEFLIAILAVCAGSLPWTWVFSSISGWNFWQGAVYASLNLLNCLFLLIATGKSREVQRGVALLLVGLAGFSLVMWFNVGTVGVIGDEFLGRITRKPGQPGMFIAAAVSLLAMIAGALQLRNRDEKSETNEKTETGPVSLPDERRRVQATSDCLFLAAGIAGVTACGVFLWLGATVNPEVPANIRLERGNLFGLSITLAVYSASFFIAGWLMRHLRNRLVLLLACVIVGLFLPAVVALNVILELRNLSVWPAAIPLWLGVPSAVWAIVMLFREEVRVAFDLTAEAQAQSAIERSSLQSSAILRTPRFSRFAIVGAVWAIFGLLAVIPALYFIGLNRVWNGTALPTDVIHSQPPLAFTAFMGALLVVGAGAPIGTTVYGAIAIWRIRRSGGKTIGLPLGVADAILFPLLAVGGLITFLVAQACSTLSRRQDLAAQIAGVSLGALIAMVVCGLIARATWRAIATYPPVQQDGRAE